MPDRVELLREGHPDEPRRDMELTGALLAAVAARRTAAVVRVFNPGPTAAFGRRDRLAPGFAAASAVATANGYAPVLRHAGGHAVVYDADAVIIEVLAPETRVIGDTDGRYADLSELISASVARLGITVELGELPDEYCPGRFSLHLPGGPKTAGIAQRIIKGASLTTAVLTVGATPRLRSLTSEIYAALGLSLDTATVGALNDALDDPLGALDAATVADTVADLALARYGATVGALSSWLSDGAARGSRAS